MYSNNRFTFKAAGVKINWTPAAFLLPRKSYFKCSFEYRGKFMETKRIVIKDKNNIKDQELLEAAAIL